MIKKYSLSPQQKQIAEAFTIWIFCFALTAYLTRAVGGPLLTYDSHLFLKMVESPLQYLMDWHPPGIAFILYGLRAVGLSQISSLAFLAATRNTLIFLILRKRFSLGLAFLGLLTFFTPEWIQLNAALWTESAFFLVVILIAYVIDLGLAPKLRFVLLALLFPVLNLIRHVGLFLMPAAALASSIVKRKELKKANPGKGKKAPLQKDKIDTYSLSLKYFGIICVLLASGLLLGNSPLRGGARQKGNQSQVCLQGLAAMSSLDYCNWGVAQKLCSFDPERKRINNANIKDPDLLFQLFVDGPIVELSKTAEECGTLKEITLNMVMHRPFTLMGLLGSRLVAHFGSWMTSELGAPTEPTERTTRHLGKLTRLLEISNQVQTPLYLTLVFAVIFMGLIRFRQIEPVIWFLVLGGLGHAFGIMVNNPFLSLRYMAISKIMIQFGFLLLIPLMVGLNLGSSQKSKKDHV